MKWNEFVSNVQQWAAERGIYENSTALMQMYKSLSEYGELVDGLAKKDRQEIKDGIGDVAVTLVNTATMLGIDLSDEWCLFNGRTTDRMIYAIHESLGAILDNLTIIGQPGDLQACEAELRRSVRVLRGIAHNEDLSFGHCLQTRSEERRVGTECRCEGSRERVRNKTAVR